MVQIIKVLSTVLGVSHDDMAEHLEAGDVAETAAVFLTKSTKLTPLPSSVLTLVEVPCRFHYNYMVFKLTFCPLDTANFSPDAQTKATQI